MVAHLLCSLYITFLYHYIIILAYYFVKLWYNIFNIKTQRGVTVVSNKNNNRKYVNLSNETISIVNEFQSLNYNSDFNTKLCEITDTFSAMINFSKRELYQFFTSEEIKLFCSAFEKKSYTPNINPKTYFQDILNDNIMFNELFNQSTEKENEFKSKVDKLTSFHCYFLLHLIREFFASEDYDNDEELKFDKYFSFLLLDQE